MPLDTTLSRLAGLTEPLNENELRAQVIALEKFIVGQGSRDPQPLITAALQSLTAEIFGLMVDVGADVRTIDRLEFVVHLLSRLASIGFVNGESALVAAYRESRRRGISLTTTIARSALFF